jgi:hypothetical protein
MGYYQGKKERLQGFPAALQTPCNWFFWIKAQ